MARRATLVSVLVPTYNGSRYLDETLLSIRRQTHRNLEIIVRDDASTDETREIAYRNAAEDGRITVVESPVNRGGAINHQELLALARGELIKFCNQDDLLDPACCATLAAQLVANPGVTLATSARRLIDADGEPLPPRAYTAPLADRDAVIPGSAVIRHLALRHMNQIGEPSTAMFRNGAVDPERWAWFGGHEARVNGDVFLWAQLLTAGDLYYHRAELSSFRIHEGQFSGNDVTFVYGHLEWAYLLEAAVRAGLVAADEECSRAASELLSVLGAVAERAADSADPRVRGSEPEIAEVALVLRSLAAGPGPPR